MRRLVMLVVSGALMVALAATAAFAQTGTNTSETIYGTYGGDTLSGRGGHDLLVGEAGSDLIDGGEGNDYLVAAYGYWQAAPFAPASFDNILAGPGHDIIDSADLAGAPDNVVCGSGFDVVYAGVEDNVHDNCEIVYRYAGY